MSYSNRYSAQSYRRKDHYGSSPFVTLLKALFALLFLIGAALGGLWLLSIIVGLSLSFFVLLLTLSPVIFFVWIVWVLFKAIIF